jgi:redox-sensing transcriptional repressor
MQSSVKESPAAAHIAWPTVVRLSEYLIILESLAEEGIEQVSSRQLAEIYGNNSNQVRQDMFAFQHHGHIGQGYLVRELEREIRHALGLDYRRRVAIVGCGRLGTTLALHVPLANYGMDLVAAFDVAPHVVGTNLGSLRIDHADRIAEICADRDVHLAALSVPKESAQNTADQLVQAGIKGIMNYTRVRLRVPEGVVSQNRQIICSFMQLSHAVGDGDHSME